jgi:hypothetical protein
MNGCTNTRSVPTSSFRRFSPGRGQYSAFHVFSSYPGEVEVHHGEPLLLGMSRHFRLDRTPARAELLDERQQPAVFARRGVGHGARAAGQARDIDPCPTQERRLVSREVPRVDVERERRPLVEAPEIQREALAVAHHHRGEPLAEALEPLRAAIIDAVLRVGVAVGRVVRVPVQLESLAGGGLANERRIGQTQ